VKRSSLGAKSISITCWRRWISADHIGGLPEEIAEMVMMFPFENCPAGNLDLGMPW
jgi:hypothetical protein